MHRIVYRMKVTALLPDQLVEEVKAHAKGSMGLDSRFTMSGWGQ